MSKKTQAYSDGYTAGQANTGLADNPFDENTQHEQWSDWKTGYADGLSERDEYEEEDGDYEDDDDDDDDYED